MFACFQEALAETEQLVYCCSAHLYGGEQSGYLIGVVLLIHDVEHYGVCVILGECLTTDEFKEVCFHCWYFF